MERVRLEAGARKDLGPGLGRVVGRVRTALRVESVDGGPPGRVALEVGGVDLDGPDPGPARQGVTDPVVAPVAAAPGLPAVVHPLGPARRDGVRRRRVEAVGRVLDPSAVLQRDDVERAERGEPHRIGNDLAVHPQPGDPAVGVLLEPQMREPALALHGEAVGRVPADGRPGDDLRPLDPGREQVLGRNHSIHAGRLDTDRLRVVAAEVGGVDDDAPDHARHAEPDERPVVIVFGRVGGTRARAAPAAGLPAVHDLALVAEARRIEPGRPGDEEVLPLGEELVVGGDDSGAQPPVGQIDQRAEGELGGAVVGVGVAAGVGVRVACETYGLRSHARCCLSRSRPVGPVVVPWSAIRRPRSQVERTTPWSLRPA